MFDDQINYKKCKDMDINWEREFFLTMEFKRNVGRRVLILMAPFPFLIIGPIQEVMGDYLLVKAEITNSTELDDEILSVHIDDIEVFYIEKPGEPKIPDIRDDKYA